MPGISIISDIQVSEADEPGTDRLTMSVDLKPREPLAGVPESVQCHAIPRFMGYMLMDYILLKALVSCIYDE